MVTNCKYSKKSSNIPPINDNLRSIYGQFQIIYVKIPMHSHLSLSPLPYFSNLVFSTRLH